MSGEPVPSVRQVGHAVEPLLEIIALRRGAAVTRASAHIRQQHGEALRDEHLNVRPKIRSGLTHRSAMHPDDGGVASDRHRGPWQGEPAGNTRAVETLPLHKRQIDESPWIAAGFRVT